MIRTDRERIAQLEARVSELTEEVEAWRAMDREVTASMDRTTRIHLRVRRLLAAHGLNRRIGPAVVRLLVHLMDRPGRVAPRDILYDVVVEDASGEVVPKIIDVRVCDARSVCEALGLPRSAIETIWGHGYSMPATFAAQLKELLEPASSEDA